MTVEMQQRGDDCIERLASSPYMVSLGSYRGVAVEGLMDDATVSFCHNLGMNRPTKAEAEILLEALVAFFDDLRNASPAFASFVAERVLRVELFVFSGQMDLRVATRAGNETSWHVALD